jgi:hypothetical protein
MRTSIALTFVLAVLGFSRAGATPLPSQEEPPRPMPLVTGSIGLDGTIDTFEKQTQRAVIKAADGVRHVFHFTRKAAVHGVTSTAEDVSVGLDVGSHVVVHYVSEGGEKTVVEVDHVGGDGLKALTCAVTDIDHRAKTLGVRVADGSVMTLHVTDRVAQETGHEIKRGDEVVVYYADEGGKRVAHYVRKAV